MNHALPVVDVPRHPVNAQVRDDLLMIAAVIVAASLVVGFVIGYVIGEWYGKRGDAT